MKTILVTGCAGFIGWKVSETLLKDNLSVVGVDNMNDYYDAKLKVWRLDQLKANSQFIFHHRDSLALELCVMRNKLEKA